MVQHDADDRRMAGNLLAVLGLIALLAIAISDWCAGETVVKRVRQGNGHAVEIRTDYGWSGFRWFERVVVGP